MMIWLQRYYVEVGALIETSVSVRDIDILLHIHFTLLIHFEK